MSDCNYFRFLYHRRNCSDKSINDCDERKHGLYATAVYLFIQHTPFDQADYYYSSEVVTLPSPTECTLKIAKAVLWLLKRIYRQGIYYQKTGVMLMELVPEQGQQTDLFG